MTNEEETPDVETTGNRISRRGALGAVAGAIVGVAALGAEPAGATGPTGQPLLLGEDNFEQGTTRLDNLSLGTTPTSSIEILNRIDASGSIGGGTALANAVSGVVGFLEPTQVTSTATVYDSIRGGVVGLAPDAPAVIGIVGPAGSGSGGTLPDRLQRTGVVGLSPDSRGVLGLVGVGTALPQFVTATSNIFLRAGVVGLSPDSPGVLGVVGRLADTSTVTVTAGAAMIGVRGVSLNPHGVGMEAVGAPHGLALNVVGSVSFSTSRRLSIPSNVASFMVRDSDVGAQSSVFVTLMGDPGTAALKWVENKPGSGFVVHLTKAPTAKVPFAYFRIN